MFGKDQNNPNKRRSIIILGEKENEVERLNSVQRASHLKQNQKWK